MARKGRKTRWRKLPIPIGPQGGEDAEDGVEREEREPPPANHPRVTFNEDEYTKITTPRQDMLFKKGYLSKKRSTTAVPQQQQTQQDNADSQSADSVESEQYVCEEPMPQYVYPPPAGYIDHTGVYFINSNTYEVYDPYTGNVTVIVGPAAYGGPGQPVLAAVPCQPVPLQPVEWFNPLPPQCSPQSRKKPSSTDSQNCSAPSSESTCPPSSPQEPVEDVPGMVYPPQYIYPGYMFGAPLYNMNGVSVQGVVPPTVLPADTKQRRKKRRRRRRGGVTDEGSESSCEEQLSCEAGAESQSGASSDAGPGSSSSKTNSDSGIHTDPTPNSGSNSPQLPSTEDRLVDFPTPPVEDSSEQALSSLDEVCVKPTPTPPPSPLSRSSSTDETSTETAPENSLLTQDPLCIERESTIPEAPLKENIENNLEQTENVDLDENINNIHLLISDLKEPLLKETVHQVYKNECPSDIEPENSNNVETIIPKNERLEDSSEKIQISTEIEMLTNEPTTMEFEDKHISECSPKPIETESLRSCTTVINQLASALADVIIETSITESVRHRSKRTLPITEAVTKWLESQGGSALSCVDTESEDEGIDEDEDETLSTGQKNVDGNPFPALSLSGSGTRVADDCLSVVSSAGEWDFYDSMDSKYDPALSVGKYYRLGAKSPRTPTVIKTAVHIHRGGPFPCGVCCLIQ